jgi:hypothetical protein
MTDQSSTTDQASATGQASRGERARRSRRQLLAGGTGALAAVLAAEALARPAPAAAANGDPVILGQQNDATSATVITNSTDTQVALHCIGTSSSGGVWGSSDIGTGVAGETNTGLGVFGRGGSTGIGVRGLAQQHAAVSGESGGDGVYGQSGNIRTSDSTRTGVHGVTDSTTAGAVWGENVGGGPGVKGTASTGDGVGGITSSGHGVIGLSTGTGDGVAGASAGGTGVLAVGNKTALKVQGPAAFSRSGVLTIKAGHSTATKTRIALTPASFVLATIQGNVAGVYVQGVTLVTRSPRSFTIHLNKTVSKNLKVAWFAVN